MYADDLVIVGDHVGRIQKILDVLSGFCIKWGLKVNMSKTKAMIYRNGGIVKKNENFYYNGMKLDNVSYYKYLGVTMSTRLSWTPAQTVLAAQARKALLMISQVNNQCEFSFTTTCKIFDTCIVPILTYGSEIWGTCVNNIIESVHMKFCKMQLGVSINTPTPAVLGECGREHIYIKCFVKSIKYWLKLLSSPSNSLLYSCYSFLYNQCLLGKSNWASEIRDLLCRHGFGWAWENQSVPDDNIFLKLFSKRVKDCELQLWKSELENMSKLRTYSLIKQTKEQEFYLTLCIPRRLKTVLAKFRTGNHNLEIEIGRHDNLNTEDRLCKYCGSNNNVVVEDEYHVLFHCPAYKESRDIFIGRDLIIANMYSFISLMTSKNTQEIINLTHFVFSVFKTRRSMK